MSTRTQSGEGGIDEKKERWSEEGIDDDDDDGVFPIMLSGVPHNNVLRQRCFPSLLGFK